MSNKDVYAIVDIEGYVKEMRDAAAKTLCENSEDNLDNFISINQMIGILDAECLGYDSSDRPLLNEDANERIYESAVVWIQNVGLAKLAAEGYIECAWDDKSNEMIFWSNDVPKVKKKKTNDKRRNKKKNN